MLFEINFIKRDFISNFIKYRMKMRDVVKDIKIA